ncbi:MAG: oxidoreductase, partial [Rhodospirillaceae bacterium]|nr:oxidoreductase [Rhodospirillaceae bacterium]
MIGASGLQTKFDLTGRTALITGAAGLLGPEHAWALLECGAMVVLTDIDAAALDAIGDRLGRDIDTDRIQSRVMDVTDEDTVRRTAIDLAGAGIQPDILVNNAAIDPKVSGQSGLIEASRLEAFSLDQWNLELAVGLTGAMVCSKIFGSAMAASDRGGVILNIASDLSVFSPDQRLYRKPET